MMKKNNSKKKVVVAISGGVDSAVAALISIRQGYEVIGATLYLHDTGSGINGTNIEHSAKEVCEILGIEHVIVDASVNFKNKVLKISELDYRSAKTPNPCTICNRDIKFAELLLFADKINAEKLVTGHHTELVQTNDFITIKKGSDNNKDQSYFLFALTPKQLSQILMPIGAMSKDQVRTIAKEAGIPSWKNKESQDTCFAVQGQNFAETLREQFKTNIVPGYFILPDGTKIAPHKGIHNYTIGQRRGLGIALGKPAFVVDINAVSGNIIVSTDDSLLFKHSCSVENVNWIIPYQYMLKHFSCSNNQFTCQVKVRYRSKSTPATVTIDDDNKITILFDVPQRAVTPGQAAVLYIDNLLIGGGWISN
jgi:tRNA-specific 2-thiouridylase